ncbi:hypothetical protein Anapl_05011 [Anas platyrhynchos]|uniref:Uncharacterized protein n=1 Tax=Anas platyrhynchos TaxID=8839 RepID=R0K4N7_ANAPL|nr:hypothetical protein Anapl_05011 [Anas platyrhynchos]
MEVEGDPEEKDLFISSGSATLCIIRVSASPDNGNFAVSVSKSLPPFMLSALSDRKPGEDCPSGITRNRETGTSGKQCTVLQTREKQNKTKQKQHSECHTAKGVQDK